MKKVIIIIICIVLGFILYTFIVAIYKANFNVDGALPSKNLSKKKSNFEKTRVTTDNLIIENGVSIDTSIDTETNNTTDCGDSCNDSLEKKRVEIYLIQNTGKLFPKKSIYDSSYWSLRNYTVDTNANSGIAVYEDGNYSYTKDFYYTEDSNGNITNMIFR